MNFVSDNAYGAAPQILVALSAASDGAAASYGDDAITARVTARLSRIFETEVFAFPVVTGTAANSLALATLCPPYGAVFCHAQSHIAVDECGAPEFYSGGARLALLDGADAKITPAAIESALPDFQRGVHSSKPSAVSITQSTELGTVYKPDEVKAIAGCTHDNGMAMHMDGARFANALAFLKCKPADITWRAGVDVLSFGATKNGALCAEAVVFFDKARVRDFEYRRKRGGHLISKMRFVSAQLEAYLEGDLWLKQAARANDLARTVADGLKDIAGVTLGHPVEGNAVFAWMPNAMVTRLREKGAQFYEWAQGSDGRTLVRLVLSFATPPEDVTRFLAAVRG
ncbi:MAG TPA: low specificity L-threonine aldolase [Rhizomicrobium sp.]|nr:low specificity L-threonine aldolase [Rhizomicrobium sp.]